ncbi:MAG TPA: hypothetical protein VIW64_02225 [Pyrinomonadaceae bacterium]
MSEACLSCGAYSVGEALPRPERELPSYGRSLLLAVTGALIVLVFLADMIIALAAHKPFSLGFWSWMAAAETAAWHFKWAMIPLALLVAFGSRRIYRSIQQSPENFCALRAARNGYIASAAVPALVLLLIGVTIPARLRHRSWGTEAARNAYIHRIDRALRDYRQANEGLPTDVNALRLMPDPDGSLAEALTNLDVSGYRPSANLAAVPTRKPQQLRGAVIRNASIGGADDPIGERLSFTNYDLPLPGEDKIAGNDDDLVVRDGVIFKVSELPHRGADKASVTKPLPR